MWEAKRLFYNKMITSFITIAYSLAWPRHSPRPYGKGREARESL